MCCSSLESITFSLFFIPAMSSSWSTRILNKKRILTQLISIFVPFLEHAFDVFARLSNFIGNFQHYNFQFHLVFVGAFLKQNVRLELIRQYLFYLWVVVENARNHLQQIKDQAVSSGLHITLIFRSNLKCLVVGPCALNPVSLNQFEKRVTPDYDLNLVISKRFLAQTQNLIQHKAKLLVEMFVLETISQLHQHFYGNFVEAILHKHGVIHEVWERNWLPFLN